MPDQDTLRLSSTIAQIVFSVSSIEHMVYTTAVKHVPLDSLLKIHGTIYLRVVPS